MIVPSAAGCYHRLALANCHQRRYGIALRDNRTALGMSGLLPDGWSDRLRAEPLQERPHALAREYTLAETARSQGLRGFARVVPAFLTRHPEWLPQRHEERTAVDIGRTNV